MSRIFLLIVVISGCSSQIIRSCPSGTQCIDRFRCAAFRELLGTASRQELNQFTRRNICSINQNRANICCRSDSSTNPPTPRPTPRPITEPTLTGRPSVSVVSAPVTRNILPTECGNPALPDRIFNGEKTELGEMPWMATIMYRTFSGDTKLDCGGSIIHPRYILTAAHCLIPGRDTPIAVRIGDYNLETNPDCKANRFGENCLKPHIDAGIDRIISHPQYGKRHYESDDIALIRLNITLDLGDPDASVRAICLPEKGFDPLLQSRNVNPIVAGWGTTEHRNTSNILLKAQTRIVPDEVCVREYASLDQDIEYGDTQICAQPLTRTGSCSGDSGGPLMLPKQSGPPMTLVGIVSYGTTNCINNEIPSVYTAVDDYIDWILQNIQ